MAPHRVQPVRIAARPKTRRRTPTLPTLAEVGRLRANARTESDGGFIEWLALTGPRPAEGFGLRWPNVDLTRGAEVVRIVEQVYRGEPVDTTKTPAGARDIIFCRRAADLLREQSAALLVDGRMDIDGPVFPSPLGHAWHASNFNRRVWRPTCIAAGLRTLKPGTLRYVYKSYVGASGLPESITMQMTGHDGDRTHRGYTRPVEGQAAMIRAALDEVFGA
ncbi:MAG TPA: tyrosine-type recombinase/integrase [Gaiellales bacterium]|nr:tyrosine-type recombinase/integrase [Gaiellales bacterium]